MSRPAAAFAAAATYTFPAFGLVFGSHAELFYDPIVLLGMLILLFGIRFGEHPSARHNMIGWGLAAGLGWWLGPTIGIYVLASVIWLLWRARSLALVRGLMLVIPSALIGAMPWIISNLSTGFASLKNSARIGTYEEHIQIFFEKGVPTIFGLRVIGADKWMVPRDVGSAVSVLLAALLVAKAVVLVRKGSPIPFAIVIGVIVVIFAIPFSYTIANGRYIYYVSTPATAVLFSGLWKYRSQALVSIIIVLSTVVWLNQYGSFSTGVHRTLSWGSSFSIGPALSDRKIVQQLEAIGATRVFADYWLAYKYVYLSDERLIITPFEVVRSDRYEQEVRTSTDPSYMFVRTSPRVPWMQTRLKHLGIAFTITNVENLVVITPNRRVLLEDLLSDRLALSDLVPTTLLPPP